MHVAALKDMFTIFKVPIWTLKQGAYAVNTGM